MMKKTAIILVISMLPLILQAQQNPVERIFNKYSGLQGITSVRISPGMFSMLANMDKGDDELRSLASSVTSLLILHAPNAAVQTHSLDFYNEVLKDLTVEHYNELMRVNSAEQQVLILADEDGGMIRELIMLVGGTGDNALICIKGNIDMKKVSSLAGINAPGMEHFMNMQE